jgi:hypothetical protein
MKLSISKIINPSSIPTQYKTYMYIYASFLDATRDHYPLLITGINQKIRYTINIYDNSSL